ncbi:MAG: glycoside hydrolase family 3 C-terminal domain-containing protein, partial [Verrucomicrobia bacterium]|nr:glycoside hydrolase family 3 C-terminal domain-containing protein [Verrucomicrobiota bacterium]
PCVRDQQRAVALVNKMTLAEKIQELHGIQNKKDKSKPRHLRYVPGVARLHIPGLRIANGPAGVGPADAEPQPRATALPAPISLAASWDCRAARAYGELIGNEARDLGDGLIEGPDVNIARAPQNGRTFEAFGEDPFLVTQMGVQEIEGIQSRGIIADVKHYVANNQETDRLRVNEVIGQRALHEIYMPAFKASVQQAHAASLMAAYNKVNGVFNAENTNLMDGVVKRRWGFKGFVTSDFGAVHSTIPTAFAGLDLEMPTGKYFGAKLLAAVQAGQVPISVIDDKLVRRFATMMQFGLFDQPLEAKGIPAAIVRRDGLQAEQLAEQGMVLLKNDHDLLPLRAAALHSIALIGPYATNAMTGGGGSSHVAALYTVSPLEGLRRWAGPGVKISLSDGRDIPQAAADARSADVAIVMVGDHEREGHDHAITLAGNQDELVAAVAAANRHTVVVLKTGSAVLMPWVDKAPAILEAWYPGEEDGNAVAAVLFGSVNPSGKLPLTFPERLSDLPAHTPAQYPGTNGVVDYSEGVFAGYRYYDQNHIQPLFPFGYGLSYTTFACKNLKISRAAIAVRLPSRQIIRVTFDVANTGHRFGKDVVQLYVSFPSTPSAPEPPRQLKGFAKVSLKPGQTRHVCLKLEPESFAHWDTQAGGWRIAPGTYGILIGQSSRDIVLRGQVTVTGG